MMKIKFLGGAFDGRSCDCDIDVKKGKSYAFRGLRLDSSNEVQEWCPFEVRVGSGAIAKTKPDQPVIWQRYKCVYTENSNAVLTSLK